MASLYPRIAFTALAVTLLAGCARAPQSHSAEGRESRVAQAGAVAASAARAPHVFGSLPDRGQLLAYSQVVRRDGAYTWHRANISEAHALHAMADGHLRLNAPSGALLDIEYDSHVEHPSGDWTWVGHLPGHPEQQTILTFGENAAFGSIAQPDGLPLRLTTRGGSSWLVETDPRKIAMVVNAATRPTHPDFKVPPRRPGRVPVDGGMSMSSAPVTATATVSASPTVDVLIGYTAAFAADNGGASGALTHLNYMVDVTNAAYTNSAISAKVRLVHAMQVSYPDATDNGTALEALTGSTGSAQTTPDPAFNALRAAREQYGADLVSLVRKYSDPENAGCGIAWLIGGGQSGVSTSDSAYGYSVVSDGSDSGTDGKTYYCLDETLAHELGHNMGAAHDVETAKGDNGVLDADEYGAYPYSFGYKTTSSSGNFYTVMAYGDAGQVLYRIFSDPRSTFCGGHACGNASTADNARTLIQTIPTVASFRAIAIQSSFVRHDFNGDGRSDVLWRNVTSGENTIWLGAASSVRQPVATVAGDGNWRVVGAGDFNGDRVADIAWRNTRTGSNVIWYSGNSATATSLGTVTNLDWSIVGIGDFDGDGRSDLFWRNRTSGANVIWRAGSYTTPRSVATVAQTAWQVVGVGDFNGDGAADVLWRNAASGANTIWRSADSTNVQAVVGVTDPNWHVMGIGDFNADGVDDVFWRNATSGANVIWRSASYGTAQLVANVGNNDWTVAQVGDFNGDMKSDLLWRNASTGSNSIWLSANASTAQSMTGVASLAWIITP